MYLGGGYKAAVFACAVQRASSSYSLAHTNKDDTDEGSALVSVLVRQILPASSRYFSWPPFSPSILM